MSLSVSTAQYLSKVGITTDPGSFGLHVARPIDAVANTVTWTWPPGMLAGFQAIPATVVFFLLTLQRATVPANRPNSAVVYNVASNQAPAADTRWTTLQTWNNGQFLADPVAQGSGYVDSWPTTNGFAHYRLILNFAKAGDPVIPPFGELTWNVAIAVPPYSCEIGPRTDGQQGSLIQWTAPQFWLDFITWSRCTTAPCPPSGYNKITIAWPFTPLPLTYRVFKSTDGGSSYFLAVASIGATDPTLLLPWYDSAPDKVPGVPIYYKFVAVESDLSTVDSNTVIASY